MIIANPIYDVVFKYLMEDIDIAKGLISAVIGEEVVELHFAAREQVAERAKTEVHPHLISLYRLDFVATVRTKEGGGRKILIELQKARLSSDISRFRQYLGKHYQQKDEVRDQETGIVNKQSLPIVAIYILGFDLEKELPPCVKVDRRYLNLITHRRVKARSEFIEALSHDVYVIQARQLRHSVKQELARILSVFGQEDFIDARGHDIDYPEKSIKHPLIQRMLRRLAKIRKEEEVREKMEFEDQMYEEFEEALKERTTTLTQTLRVTGRELEEAKAREEQERREKEQAKAHAVRTLAEKLGIPEDEARAMLGY